jgi:hypothetical protein
MKITKSKLTRIILEETSRLLKEFQGGIGFFDNDAINTVIDQPVVRKAAADLGQHLGRYTGAAYADEYADAALAMLGQDTEEEAEKMNRHRTDIYDSLMQKILAEPAAVPGAEGAPGTIQEADIFDLGQAREKKVAAQHDQEKESLAQNMDNMEDTMAGVAQAILETSRGIKNSNHYDSYKEENPGELEALDLIWELITEWSFKMFPKDPEVIAARSASVTQHVDPEGL